MRPIHKNAVREYDIRGIAGLELTDADGLALGSAFGTRIVESSGEGSGRRVCVGRDARLHAPGLEAAVVEGLRRTGVEVLRLGLCSTPCLQFTAQAAHADGAAMITASHNPAAYIGIKFIRAGRALHGREIRDLAGLAATGPFARGTGSVRPLDGTPAYLDALKQAAAGAAPLRGAWDAGNGMAGLYLPELLAALPGDHVPLFVEPDGRFPNRPPDCSTLANLGALCDQVVSGGLDLGFAFDGDGDRITVVGPDGVPLLCDDLTAILAADLLPGRPGAAIVFDAKAGEAALAAVRALGGVPVLAPSGRASLRACMDETGAPLGGEVSGHIFHADWPGLDDGLHVALRLLGVLGRDGRGLSGLAAALGGVRTPELRIPVAAPDRAAAVGRVRALLERAGRFEVSTLDGIRARDGGACWILRASNTEDCLVLRAEAPDRPALAALACVIAAVMARAGIALDPALIAPVPGPVEVRNVP